MANRLPEYWAVLNDGSEEFKEVVNYRNKHLEYPHEGIWVGDCLNKYYGYDGNTHGGYEVWKTIEIWKNKPTILTPKEFIELSKEVEEDTPITTFQAIANNLVKMLEEKNKLYGDSALNPIQIFAGKTMVGQRADDKISRIKNSPELRKNDISDLMGYLILICKENNWTTFTDQID